MKSAVRQTKIPFSERKLRVRTKCVTPKKIDSSEDEKSPLKYKLVSRSESKIVLRRSSESRSRSILCSPDYSSKSSNNPRSTPKRAASKKSNENDENEDCPTPSKRKCCNDKVKNEKTPEKTPSTLLSRLQINSAKSIKNNTESDSPSKKHLEPKELFPSTNASSARKALYNTYKSLPGREEEVKKLFEFLETHLEEQSCGSIYIAGLPGTGKTASIEHVIQTDKIMKGYHIIKINCTCVSSSVSIYKRICSELKIKTNSKAEKDPKVLVEKYLLRRHKMVLLILDEIDQLETRSQSVLYNIFEWPSWEKARLVLIGIANAMDLTDRILPRLCAKVELKPVLIHFTPYSKEQIKSILSHRLSEVGADSIFTPSAIELISAKVAGMSGDVRRALDLGRRVVEVSEESKGTNLENSDKSPVKKINPNSINPDLLTDFLKLNDFRRSPRKLSLNGRKLQNGDGARENLMNENEMTPTKQPKIPFLSPNGKRSTPQSRKKLFDDDSTETGTVLREISCYDRTLNKREDNRKSPKASPEKFAKRITPRKSNFLSPVKMDSRLRESPVKGANLENSIPFIKSPRKNNFSIDSKDVLNVVKNIYGSSKALKSNTEDSSFPLHQKILICTFLLISKKGKVKDLNVGKLHQVYTKICTKRGITPVDQSGFLFLCRQVEMTGIMQIGKGPGKLAKISLQWDEAEVTDALKDLNLLSSILNDVSCL